MKTFTIREALTAGWASYTRRPWYLLGIVLSFITLFLISLGDAFVTALAYILYTGYLGLLIKHYHGERVVFDDLFTIDKRWIYFAFLGLIKCILILLGLICFVLPGVYLAIRWMFAELYVINDGMRPVEALRASYALTQGHWWHLFLFTLTALLLALVGVVCLVVGFFVAAVVLTLATIYIFETLRKPLTHVEEVNPGAVV